VYKRRVELILVFPSNLYFELDSISVSISRLFSSSTSHCLLLIQLTTTLKILYINIPKKRMPTLDGILKTPIISLYRLIIRELAAQDYYTKKLLIYPQKILYLPSTNRL